MARPGSHRPQQVAETVRQVLGEALVREVRDPRVGRVSVTSVSVTPDLAHARVRVIVPGSAEERERALTGLASAAGFLRGRVARALDTRVVPELHFEADLGLEHAARINEVLASLKREEEQD